MIGTYSIVIIIAPIIVDNPKNAQNPLTRPTYFSNAVENYDTYTISVPITPVKFLLEGVQSDNISVSVCSSGIEKSVAVIQVLFLS